MRSLVALVLALAAGGACAQKATDAYFRSLDLNGDGYVSLSEAAGDEVIVSRFDRADKNRDGKLSPKEFANLKNIKLRVAARKKDKQPSAAVGSTAPPRPKPASGLNPGRKSGADGG